MTKARARERAKAKAGQKAKKRDASPDQPDRKVHPGKFDPGANSMTSPTKANANNPAGARRGAARSR